MTTRISVLVFNNFIVALLTLTVLWLIPGKSEALTVSELDFAGGSIALSSGSTTVLSSNFTTSGRFFMGQYQPLPNIIPPVPLGLYTFSLFTSGPNPAPTSSTSESTITADLTALGGKLTGPLLPSGGVMFNIGGAASGIFNAVTHAFAGLTWTHGLGEVSGLPATWGNPANLSLRFTMNGTARFAAVPLPGAALLFLSGLSSVVMVRKRLGQ